jgi:predicted amidohydrolase
MWNTNLLFDADGTLLNRHRKLVPTWAEKLTWANGDASNLRVEQTELAKLGMLICGENTNTLARFALLAQGEQVHIASYPPAWPVRRPGANQNYNLTDAIRIRSAAHAFEGKVFNVVASCALDEQAISEVSQGDAEVRRILASAPPATSMILGPQGELLAEPHVDGEGMVVAEIDISLSIEQKQIHDIVGSYNRFDVFRRHHRAAHRHLCGAGRGRAEGLPARDRAHQRRRSADQEDLAQHHQGRARQGSEIRRRRLRGQAEHRGAGAVALHQREQGDPDHRLTSSAVAVALNKLAQREKVLYLPGISGSNDTTGKDCVRYSLPAVLLCQTAARRLGRCCSSFRQEQEDRVPDAGLHLWPHRAPSRWKDF